MKIYSKSVLALIGALSINLAMAQDANTMDEPGGDNSEMELLMQRMDESGAHPGRIENMEGRIQNVEQRLDEQGGGNLDMEGMIMERLDSMENNGRMATDKMDNMENNERMAVDRMENMEQTLMQRMDESGAHPGRMENMEGRIQNVEQRLDEQSGGNPDMEGMIMERMDNMEQMLVQRMDDMERRFEEATQ